MPRKVAHHKGLMMIPNIDERIRAVSRNPKTAIKFGALILKVKGLPKDDTMEASLELLMNAEKVKAFIKIGEKFLKIPVGGKIRLVKRMR